MRCARMSQESMTGGLDDVSDHSKRIRYLALHARTCLREQAKRRRRMIAQEKGLQ